MRPIQRLVSAAVLIALASAMGGCSSMSGFDPSDLLDFLDTKKKLPGDRKPVFPEGVPGLQQGVPRELYRGAQTEQPPQQPVAVAPPAEEPRGRNAKSKGRVNVGAVRSAPEAAPADPDAATAEEGGAAAVPAEPKGRKIVRRRTTAPPPDASAAPQAAPAQQAAPGSAFPAPVPSGTFTR